MHVQLKIILTLLTAGLAAAVLFVDSHANNAGSSSFWRLGRRDPVRNLFFRGDGSLRRFAKPLILLWFLLWTGALWIVVPTT
jgi:hypothetical protein